MARAHMLELSHEGLWEQRRIGDVRERREEMEISGRGKLQKKNGCA